MYKKTCEIFTSFDLFRQPVVFYYNGKTKRTSFLGFICSLLIYIYLFYSFFNSNFFLKNVPIVIPESIENDRAGVIHFDSSRTLIFGIADPLNNRFTDPTYFKLLFRYYPNLTYFEERELKLCELEDINGNLSYFQSSKLGQMFCLKNNSFYLKDSLDQAPRYIAISILLCDNSTSNNTCKSPEEINDYFDNFNSQKFFNIVYDDRRVDIQDYTNPIKNAKKVISQLIDPKIKKKYFINLKKISVETEAGIIFSDINKVSDYSYSSMDFDFQLRTNSAQPLSQYIFLATKEEMIYNRRYQSFAEFLANFIGIAKFISVICFIFTNNLIYVHTLKYVINKLYTIPLNISPKKKSRILKKNKKKTGKKPEISDIVSHSPDSNLTLVAGEKGITNVKETKSLILNSENSNKFHTDKILFKSSRFAMPDLNNNQSQTNTLTMNCQLSQKVSKTKHPFAELTKISNKQLEKEDSLVLEHFSESQHEEKNIEMDEIKEININEKAAQSSDKTFDKTNKTLTKSKKIKDKIKNFFKRAPKEMEMKLHGKLNLTFWQYICLKISFMRCKKNSKQKLIEKAEKTFEQDLDVVNILTKLHDLEKLKILLLDEDQLVIFNFLSKPMITIENESDQYRSQSERKITTMINRDKNAKFYLEESYKKVLKKNDKISQRLVEFFDKEISILVDKK